ncbi:glycosyl hydrolase [Sphaerisporangium krabiense]|uniref:Beta-glucosidase n=1 Tax=Sphaerisporangium krabiense TaxID=763782 RepID=A0A7W8Z868_9ACTN|nr:glycoside hydrolase family 3 C-terminal domain-containing protein [Sphaerisporangium krabiense]MBB5629115.1 beta-glucosidase [Sphaerisporangium krabiense]GII60045.1 glycosyl hydrolase [Sphaerisporangium krabiense]
MDIEELIRGLDLREKVRLLTGAGMWTLPALSAAGLRELVVSDGPAGVRGGPRPAADPSIALPCPTALAATWDVALVRRAGLLLGREARRKGVHVLLAPRLNVQRGPLSGRHFECFSEDPLLTGEIGAAYVEGVQRCGVAAAPGHFVAGDAETGRFTADVVVDEAALREVYLAPFERVARAGAWAVTAAGHAVGGTTMTEHAGLLRGVLKEEWGFDGVVLADRGAARSTEPAALAGLDVVLPGPGGPWGGRLEEAVRAGRVPEHVLDDKVRRVLRLAARTGALAGATPGDTAGVAVGAAQEPPAATVNGSDAGPVDNPVDGSVDGPIDGPIDGRALAREVAVRSFTLLRNEGGLLPLGGIRSVALVGAAAAEPRIMGGGAARVFPERVVSPLEGLRRREGLDVRHTVGTDPRVRLAPLATPSLAVFRDDEGATLAECPLPTAEARWIGELPPGLDAARLAAVELRASFTPAAGGPHQFSISGAGAFALAVDGHTVLEETLVPAPGEDPASVLLSPPERRIVVELEAGVPVALTVRHATAAPDGVGHVAFGLGHGAPAPDDEVLIAEAAGIAAGADVAVVVVGTTEETEGEGFDRAGPALPGRQDELVARVAAANPRTIVVVNAGAPVEMPWLEQVAAVLLVWFPGQEFGDALADVLFGEAEPGGRLPTTWPARLADAPVPAVAPVEGTPRHEEGALVGHRAWAASGRAPAFWFGHGLGYTSWSYEALAAAPAADGGASVTVAVRNTGGRAGREVVQVYVAPPAGADGGPPPRLAGFAVAEAEPGTSVLVTIPLPERAFQEWAGAGWRAVPGRHLVRAGRSAADLPLAAALTVAG